MTGRAILFELHPSSGVPIYRQLVDQVHALIAGGRIAPGDMLPSVRDVARTAQVNPMTVSKAYSRLEVEGVVQRIRGQGMRVLEPNSGGSLRERRQEFLDLAAPAIHRAIQLGLDEQQIQKAVSDVLEQLSARPTEQ